MGKNRKRQYDVLIIGGGAAGCMAAVTAAREGCSVCILEKQNKIGKKLLATGNGKCNFTNASMGTFGFHGDETFISQVLQQFQVEDCLDFFHSIGIFPKSKNGYYYPQSEQAASVVQAFEQELSRLGVTVLFSAEVTSIVSGADGVQIRTDAGLISGKKLIIATGLLASPKLGSDGSLFDIVKGLGHRFAPVLPALCGFYCKGLPFKKVSGVRVQGTVAACIDDKKVAEDTGELQFTDYGLSGIPVFQISHVLSKGVYEKRNVTIMVTLLPEFDRNRLLDELNYRKKRFADTTVDYLFNGLLPQKLSDIIFEKMHWERDRFIASLSENDIQKLADTIRHLQVKVTNYRDFEFAQVCTGGIPVTEIVSDTLESKFAENVYFAGEILDVDGICGGYNLHFAWATGYMAGKAVCR